MSTVPYFEVSSPLLREIAQTMLEMKKMGRSLENSADALIPLTDHPDVKAWLTTISNDGRSAAKNATDIYHLIARAASQG